MEQFFLIKVFFNLFLLFNMNFIKSWLYSNLMEIGFYSNARKNEKNKCRRYDLNLGTVDYQNNALASMADGNF